jgi:hypothetical protein
MTDSGEDRLLLPRLQEPDGRQLFRAKRTLFNRIGGREVLRRLCERDDHGTRNRFGHDGVGRVG